MWSINSWVVKAVVRESPNCVLFLRGTAVGCKYIGKNRASLVLGFIGASWEGGV